MTTATAVKEIPILMTGPMVRLILRKKKWQTRRIAKLPDHRGFDWRVVDHFERDYENVYQPILGGAWMDGPSLKTPYGRPGDRLWVRETFGVSKFNTIYAADSIVSEGPQGNTDDWDWSDECKNVWRPSIFLPRTRCRLTLDVIKHARLERVKSISEADAIAEGMLEWTKDGDVKKYWPCDPCEGLWKCAWAELPRMPREAFFRIWVIINGQRSLDANPWVWVVSFGDPLVKGRA